MKPEASEHLAALAAAAQGRTTHQPARERKIAALKARFEAGILTVDEQALASKLIDAHIDQPTDHKP